MFVPQDKPRRKGFLDMQNLSLVTCITVVIATTVFLGCGDNTEGTVPLQCEITAPITNASSTLETPVTFSGAVANNRPGFSGDQVR